ncbi:putative protein CC1G_03129 Coprinopsis cinerea okayama7 130 [Lyophyllum shimeji]|uniref:Ig-like domain-containing protein n=1 Tax=Lyophyllum shimeji TaxID=47721 RepID=A0A9P3PD77_LYOSH|nr:putative protein CC1G_03129 Coprinopsis cinerea okayama7 130 [Lyophyllum shimeji]
MQYLCKFGRDGSSRSQTFYSGRNVSTRMESVRQAIIYVRENWRHYPSLMTDLRSYIQELTNEDAEISPHLPAVLSSYKVWNSHDGNLSVIRLYTSQAGYDQIFRIINQAFRTDDLTEQEKRLRCAVFLIELLNVDLFNYTLREGRSHNFQGTVYRGVIFSEDQLQDFKNLATLPVAERYWAVPLAMMSASTDKEVALRGFAGIDAITSDAISTRHPFLWRIHVLELKPKYMRIYHDRFPSSVVSTICAVPIREVSEFAGEDEVLLRGPFFQLICLREELFEGRETPIHVMELVMINANRDHPSTMELSPEEGEKARQWFACLVGCGEPRSANNWPRSTGSQTTSNNMKGSFVASKLSSRASLTNNRRCLVKHSIGKSIGARLVTDVGIHA